MSTTVDQRVVEMRFDNRQFEKNVSTTMSTLDKLKQKLNFKGAADSLENVNAAAKKVNMNGLNNAVDTVHAKFSALQVMGVTALANITNSAVNAGKKIVSALTIDPVKSGFREYETQLNSVQTILSNTSHEGKTIEDVNKALDELNKYADQTIYNFTEMTRNIGTFTAAGVKLDTSVSAIKGIANLAAVSGSTSQQASTAMYQLSQALAAGKVSLMDWNSVVNAGMGGKVFQDALTRTARVMGTGVDADIAKYGSFRESLSRGGWLTTEVLTETLEQFTMSAKEGSEEWNNFMASLQKKGYTEEQATEILKMANNATDAATKIKTFTQLWDVMKETAQSGWYQTWKLVFGDFEEAKDMFTRLSKPILGFIEGMGNARNAILNSAFSKNFKGLVDSIKNVAKPAKEAMRSIEDLGKIVDKVINGDFGNGKKRLDELTKQGINYYRVQNKVNEKLGNSFRYTEKQIEAQDKLLGKQKSSTKATKEQSEATAEYIADLTKLSDAQLKELGYNEKQIESIRELTKLSKKLGIPVKELIENIDKIDGRWLFIESFANIGKSFITVAKSIGQAWKDIFPSSAEDKGNALFEIVAGMHRISRKFLDSTNKNADKLKRTFKGLFAIVDILTTVLGGGFKITFKVISSILGAFNLNILDVTAFIGDALVGFRDFIDGALDFGKIFKWMVPYIKKFIEVIKDGFSALKKSRFAEIAKDCLIGFKDGLVSGVKGLWKHIKSVGQKILDVFSNMLGVQSPSWKFFNIARDCIVGFVNGIKAFAKWAWNALKEFGGKCIDILKKIDFGKVIAVGLIVGTLLTIKHAFDVLGGFSSAFEGFGNLMDALAEKVKANTLKKKANALLTIAAAIGILAGSLYLLSRISWPDLGKAALAMIGLVGVLTALVFITKAIGDINVSVNINKISAFLLSFSAAMLIMAFTLKTLSTIDSNTMGQVVRGLGTIVASLAGTLAIFGLLVSGDAGKNMDKAGSLLIKMAIAMYLMVGVIRVASTLDGASLRNGLKVVGAIELLFAGIIGISLLSGANASKAGSMILKMSVAFIAMLAVVKMASKLDPAEFNQGIMAVAKMEALFVAIIAVSRLAGSSSGKVGWMLLEMSGALWICMQVAKTAAKMSDDDLNRGLKAVTALEGLFMGIIGISHFANKNVAKIGKSLLNMALALLVIVGVIYLLTKFKTEDLIPAVGVVVVLEAMFGYLLKASRHARNSAGAIYAMAVAVGIIALAIAGLSFIPKEDLLASAGALSIAMVAFSMMLESFSKITKTNTKIGSIIGIAIVMVAVAAILAVIIAKLSDCDPKQAIGSAIALGVLLVAFAGAMKIINDSAPLFKKSWSTMGQLVLTMGVLVVVIMAMAAVLKQLNDLDPMASVGNAIALSILLGALAGVLVVLGFVPPDASVPILAVATLGLVLLEIGAIIATLNKIGLKNIPIEMAFSLSTLLLALSVATAILSGIGALAGQAVLGALGLVGVVTVIGSFIAILGLLWSKWGDKIGTWLDGGIDMLIKLFSGIGRIIGALVGGLVGGVMEGVASSLPAIGESLSDFMTNAEAFIDGCKNIDGSVIAGAGYLSGAIIALSIADLINGAASLFSRSFSLATLGIELSAFMVGAKTFIDGLKNIDPSVGTTAGSIADAIMKFTSANMLDGIMKLFSFGTNSLSKFGDDLESLGKGIARFGEQVKGMDESTLTAINISAQAGVKLAEMASALPNSGGLVAWFTGDNADMSYFGEQLVAFGIAMTSYGKSVKDVDGDAINNSIGPAQSLIAVANNIPNSGGALGWLMGENDMGAFGTNLVEFGKCLKNYSMTVAGLNAEAIYASVEPAQAMVDVANKVPNVTGSLGWLFTGESNFGTFSSNIVTFGGCLVSYANTVKGVDTESITESARAASELTKLADSVPVIGGMASWWKNDNDLESFGKKLVSFGKKLVDYSNAIAGLSTAKLGSTTTQLYRVMDLFTDAASVDFGGADSFAKALEGLGDVGLDKFIEAFENAEERIIKTGKGMVDNLIQGAELGATDFTREFEGLAELGAHSMENKQGRYYDAGVYLITGFADGISDNVHLADYAASQVAASALAALEKELDEHSPSREAYKRGDFFGLGFVNAIKDYRDAAYAASSDVGSSAKNGLNDAIHKANDLMFGEIDTQPTIRPVVDLTDVRNSSGLIANMFNGNHHLNAVAAAGSIGYSMNHRIQNGTNNDVISAIKNLGKNIGNTTNYNVNGVTYDDGSNISDTVKALIRQARIERRV